MAENEVHDVKAQPASDKGEAAKTTGEDAGGKAASAGDAPSPEKAVASDAGGASGSADGAGTKDPDGDSSFAADAAPNSEGNADQETTKVEAATLPEGTMLSGEVTSVRESFGFVRCPDVSDEIFFHVSALRRPGGASEGSGGSSGDGAGGSTGGGGGSATQRVKSLTDHVRVGDQVELKLGRNKKQSDRTIGVEVIVTKKSPEAPAAPLVPMRGVVRKRAAGPRTHKVDDGLIAYTDAEGVERTVPFGNHSVSDGKGRPLEEGCPVSFKILPAAKRGSSASGGAGGGQQQQQQQGADEDAPPADVARAVQVQRERVSSTEGGSGAQGAQPAIVEDGSARELGTVTVRKPQFGFIKCCERAGDLFFHVSAVVPPSDPPSSDAAAGASSSSTEGGPAPGAPDRAAAPADELRVGDDVEFSVGRDPHTRKPVALRVSRVPKGTAVFEVVSDKQYTGTVLERAAVGKNYSQVSSGVLEYEDGGTTHKLIFGVADLKESRANPSPGDKVTFRIATNLRAARTAKATAASDSAKPVSAAAQHAGRRATAIAAVRVAGRVATLRSSFGFIRRAKEEKVAAADKAGRWGKAELPPLPAPAAAATPPPGDGDAAVAEDSATAAATAAGDKAAGQQQADGGGGKEAGDNKGREKKQKERAAEVFFHLSEVEDGVQLRVGDEVDFVLWENPKTGEANARRVRRTREAPAAPQPAGGGGPSGNATASSSSSGAAASGSETPQPSGERRKLVLTPPTTMTAPKHGQALYMPKGPDGTKGFTLGRGRPLGQPPGPAKQKQQHPKQPPPPRGVHPHAHSHGMPPVHGGGMHPHMDARGMHAQGGPQVQHSFASPFNAHSIQTGTHQQHLYQQQQQHPPLPPHQHPHTSRLPPMSPRTTSYGGMVPGTTVLMSVVTDARGRPNLLRVTSSGGLDANAPVFIPRTVSTASMATESSFVSCDDDTMSRSPA